MEIPNLISKLTSDSPEKEYFFALEISSYYAKASIWTISGDKVQVLSSGNSFAWGGKDKGELIAAADSALSVAIQNLKSTNGNEPKKVVFGLPESWILKDKIKPEFQPFLKELTQKLSLHPIGFVVTTEAIVHQLKVIEGVPPSIILIGVGEMVIEITLIKLGQSLGTQTIARSISLGDDVEEGLTRFGSIDMLPSRILLYDSQSNLEEAKQQLLDRPWQERFPFLHFPKVEILSPDHSINAVSIAGGSEFAKSTAFTSGSPVTEEKSPSSKPYFVPSVEIEPDPMEQDLGFIQEKDILQVAPPPQKQPQETSLQTDPQPQSSKRKFSLHHFSLPKLKLPSFKLNFPKFNSKSSPSISSPPQKRHFKRLTLLGIIGVIILSIPAAMIAAYIYLPKATIEITVEPKQIDKQLTLTIDPASPSADITSKTLPGTLIEMELDDEKTAPTTGQKTVGDKATGEVTIYNATPQERKFAAGTILTSPSGLKFTLSSNVSVASKSGTAISSDPGRATVDIAAASIGEEYNLSSDTEFKVGTFTTTDIAAKNSTAITGGSSRQVQAVGKSDLENLKSSLTEELIAKAREVLSSKLDADSQLVDSSITTSVSENKSDKKVGEEGDTITLKLKIKAAAISFKTADLNSLVMNDLESSAPSGYQIQKDQLEPQFTTPVKTKDTYTVDVTLSAKLLPQIAIDDIRNNIAGKSAIDAQNYLKNLPGFLSAQAQITPKFIPNLPRLPKNIEIIIKSSPVSK